VLKKLGFVLVVAPWLKRAENYSTTQEASANDSHRTKQILDKYGLGFKKIS
jgi:hypothetical protein